MNLLQKTWAFLMPLKRQNSLRTLFVSVQRQKDLKFRRAEPSDFEKVVKLSKGLHDGDDYLPFVFQHWHTFDNAAVMLGLDGDRAIALHSCLVVDDGKTAVLRAACIAPEYRGQGVLVGLYQGLNHFLQENFPNVVQERFCAYTAQIPSARHVPWRRVAEFDALHYNVDEKTSLVSEPTSENTLEVETFTREYFSDVMLSPASTEKLFANNLLVVDRVPFEPLPSNIDVIFRENYMHMFVEKGSKGAWPRSFSHGVFVQRVDALEWLASFHTDDPALFKAHLLHQFQRACEVIQSKFTFFTFQDKGMTPLARSVLGDTLQLKEVDLFGNAPLGVFEREFRGIESLK